MPWYFSGICADPWLTGFSLNNDTGLDTAQSLQLFTDILGDFIGVDSPRGYATANAEFWCKNCPNDYRKNCPFDPVDENAALPGMQVSDLCECPGGRLSQPGQPFWSFAGDNQLSGRYIMCADQAKVYRSWIEALFPNEWDERHYSLAEMRFYNTCFSRKGTLGFILTVGPVLGFFSCVMTLFSLFKYCATTGLPGLTFNFILLTISMTLVSFWPLSFTGASELISRFAFCWNEKGRCAMIHTARSSSSNSSISSSSR